MQLVVSLNSFGQGGSEWRQKTKMLSFQWTLLKSLADQWRCMRVAIQNYSIVHSFMVYDIIIIVIVVIADNIEAC